MVSTEAELAALAAALGAADVKPLSSAEAALIKGTSPPHAREVRSAKRVIRDGGDPLGELFCGLRSPAMRRGDGAVYTPDGLVEAMVAWASGAGRPARVVDAGAGSGRFLLAAGRAFRKAHLIGVESDPLAALLARANLSVAGLAGRSHVLVQDYRAVSLPPAPGPTLYIGNPPYVRHHLIPPAWKDWLVREARRLGCRVSQLAGLHLHFYLATALHAAPGDYGVFVTAAEWLDVNYGRLLRELLLGPLGGRSIHVIDPAALPFSDAATTAAIATFEIGSTVRSIRVKRVTRAADLDALGGGRPVRRERLETQARWSTFTRAARRAPQGFVELGELCRVHRGQVTGANAVWIAGPGSPALPERVLYPAVTRARELIRAGAVLSDASSLRRVIDLPADLEGLSAEERSCVERFLAFARKQGAHLGFIARNRKAWWSVGLREPAAVLATYMARRPPAFVRNLAGARHINIAHGLYPREALTERELRGLVAFLNAHARTTDGRTYAGGLTKFEPREMERLLIPTREELGGEAGAGLAWPADESVACRARSDRDA